MDTCKTSTICGYTYVTVGGIKFTCDLSNGDWSCDKPELLDSQEVIEALQNADGVIYGMLDDMDALMGFYEIVNHCECNEYYYCEEDNVPLDVDEIPHLDEEGFTKIDDYYLVNVIEDADEEHDGHRWTVAAMDDPDDYGRFPCKLLLLDDDDNIIEIRDSSETFTFEY